MRALGYAGEVSGLGAWGPIVNGGAWLTVKGIPVDLLFRDLDWVEHWPQRGSRRAFRAPRSARCLVGGPSYVLAGELALGQPLTGELPRAEFSDALAASASRYWHGRARVWLMFAENYAKTAEQVCCLGMLASAILCAAHPRLAHGRESALNEKRLVERAGLRMPRC